MPRNPPNRRAQHVHAVLRFDPPSDVSGASIAERPGDFITFKELVPTEEEAVNEVDATAAFAPFRRQRLQLSTRAAGSGKTNRSARPVRVSVARSGDGISSESCSWRGRELLRRVLTDGKTRLRSARPEEA